MSKAPSVVLGIFTQSKQLGAAVNALPQAGFSEKRVTLLVSRSRNR